MLHGSRLSAAALLAGFNDRIVLALGLTPTIGYGTLYYAYGVLAPAISREFGVGIDWFFGAFTIGLLLGGLVAPVVGRELDRRGARQVMSVGSLAAAGGLVACAIAPNIWAFSVAVMFTEAASCLVLYEAAFAGLTQIYRHEARRGITLITLIAGFASTIFWPLTQWMLGALDWRWTLLIFAVAHVVIGFPLHVWVLGLAKPVVTAVTATALGEPPPVLVGGARRRALVVYTSAIVIAGLVTSAFPWACTTRTRTLCRLGLLPSGQQGGRRSRSMPTAVRLPPNFHRRRPFSNLELPAAPMSISCTSRMHADMISFRDTAPAA